MNFLKRSLWAAVATAAVAGGASAQLGGAGGTGGTGGTGGITLGGGGGQGGGITLGGGGGQGGGQGGGGQGGAGGVGGAIDSGSAVTIRAPSQIAQAPQGVSTANGIGKYYANPMYQGRAGTTSTSLTAVVNPGGFATPLYGTGLGAATTTGGAGGRGGAGGGTSSGFGGAATSFGSASAGGVGGGGFGATGGGNTRGQAAGGVGGATGNTQAGQVVTQGAPGISYTASIKFAVPTVTPAQFQSDLQAVISRSSSLSNPGGVQLTTGPNGAVTLRGQVKDEDEARLVEGLLRLTPGVRDVTNGLTFPKQ